MANILDIMDLRQILQLYYDGLSNREIGKILSISRNTVNQYVRRFRSSEYNAEELVAMDRSNFEKLFTYRTTLDVDRQDELMRYFEQVNKARHHPGFTFLYHYTEYASSVENPYSYTQFLEHYRRKYGKVKGSMKLNHEAGKEMFIDFAGKKMQYLDKATGEIVEVDVFIAILQAHLLERIIHLLETVYAEIVAPFGVAFDEFMHTLLSSDEIARRLESALQIVASSKIQTHPPNFKY